MLNRRRSFRQGLISSPGVGHSPVSFRCWWGPASLSIAVVTYAGVALAQPVAPQLPSSMAEPSPSPSVSSDAGESAISAESYHAEGVRLLRERRMEAAIVAFEHAANLDDKSSLFATDLGYAYLLSNRLAEAESAFRQGIVLDPTRPQAYGHLVDCLLREPNRWEKRAELFRILDQGVRDNSERERRQKIEVARIRAERSFGLLDRARQHIEEALSEHPARAVEKQILALKSSLVEDEKARRDIRDWPEPDIPQKGRERYAECERLSASRTRKECLACLADLLEQYPAWRAPRRLRAQSLVEQGHYDEAVKELSTLILLCPSEPTYYRQLGLLLAEHGGLLELERADRSLHMAMALEPEWTDLAPVRQKLASRRFDTLARTRRSESHPPEPTENARRLYDEAESSIDEGPEGRKNSQVLLEQALRESPTYVEAAALWFSVTRRVPEKTVDALWHDGARLFALYQECARMEPALPHSVLDRWLNRAIELGSINARLARALSLRSRGDRVAAERELANYLALISDREEVESVQQLRSELLEKPNSGKGVLGEAILNARVRLKADDLEGALRQLDAPCQRGQEPDRLLWLGLVYEEKADTEHALNCYEFGLEQTTDSESRTRLARRFARLLARSESKYLVSQSAARLPAIAALEPAAHWALARRALEKGQADLARDYAAKYLSLAASDDRFVPEARAVQQRLMATDQQHRAQKRRRLAMGIEIAIGASSLLGVLIYLVAFRGLTVERAVRRFPRLFPELRRVIGQLRHDVLKHRTSALGLLAQEPAALIQIRQTLLEPVPVSAVVTKSYIKLQAAARAQGVRLRRLTREPIFGALVKDLRLVEHSLDDLRKMTLLREIDQRLRTIHSEGLQRLLSKGPSFRLNAGAVERWIALLEAELAGQDQPWAVPALQMSDPSLSFPVDESALFQIFTNLLRNAEAAINHEKSPKVLVRLLRESDFAGKSWVKLQILDNADGSLCEEDVENAASDRGLGIVRNMVREWHGRIVLQREAPPYQKSFSVEFAP